MRWKWSPELSLRGTQPVVQPAVPARNGRTAGRTAGARGRSTPPMTEHRRALIYERQGGSRLSPAQRSRRMQKKVNRYAARERRLQAVLREALSDKRRGAA